MDKTLKKIVSDYYALLGVDVDGFKLNFECQNRENVPFDLLVDKTKLEVLPCPHNKEHFHIYSLKNGIAKDYSLAAQVRWLDNIRTKIARGEYEGRKAEYLTLGIPTEVELDILARGAQEYIKEAKISRRELMKWYVCERKVQYSSLDEDDLTCIQLLEPELHPYLCPYDNSHYHLGHKPSWRKNSSVNAKNAYLMYKKREKKKQEKLRKAS